MSHKEGSASKAVSWFLLGTIGGSFFLVTLLVFGASISHGFSSLDDRYLVLTNLAIRGPTPGHLLRIFTSFDPELYIPFTLLSYQLNYLVSGLNPAGYHALNLLLHAGSGVLLAWVLLLLFRSRLLAVVLAAIWLVHPINTEAVAWVAGRKDVLSTFFALAATVAYLQCALTGSRTRYAVSILLFLCALLSKATVVTLPAVWLLLDWSTDRPLRKNLLTEKIPHVVLSVIVLGIALLGKSRALQSSFYHETVLMAFKSTAFYLQKILLPTELTAIYPYQKAIALTSPDFFVPVIIVIAVFVAVLWSLRQTRWVAAGWLMFLFLLSPTYFNFHKGEQIFFAVDRYVYLPMIGLLVILGYLTTVVTRMLDLQYALRNIRRWIFVIPVILIIGLGMLSAKQTSYWQSDLSLFSHALALYPDSVPARISLSVVHREAGDIAAEKKVLEDGLRQMPTVAYYTGLGSIAARMGDVAQAESMYRSGMTFDPTNPEPYFYLASLREQQGKTDEAVSLYQQAADMDDSYVAAFNNLGGIYQESGKLDLAAANFTHALEVNPYFMEGQYNLFQVLEMQKKYDEAYPHLLMAYELAPDEPDIAIGLAYRKSERGEVQVAKDILLRLLVSSPENATAKRFLQQLQSSGNN